MPDKISPEHDLGSTVWCPLLYQSRAVFKNNGEASNKRLRCWHYNCFNYCKTADSSLTGASNLLCCLFLHSSCDATQTLTADICRRPSMFAEALNVTLRHHCSVIRWQALLITSLSEFKARICSRNRLNTPSRFSVLYYNNNSINNTVFIGKQNWTNKEMITVRSM